MATLSKEEIVNKKVWLNSLKIFAKILVFAIALIIFLIGILFFLAPKFDAKLFNFLGLTKAEEKCYEQIYKNSGSTSDLYNLVVYEMNNNNLSQELNYILMLYKAEDYEEFCNKLNASGIKSANENKSLYIYVADTKAFLINQEIKCRIQLGISSNTNNWSGNVIIRVREYLSDENLTENSYYAFMYNVYKSSNLTLDEKQSIACEFLSIISSENHLSSEELISQRIENIKLAYEEEETVQKILLKYAEAQMYAGQYYYLLMLNGGEESTNSLEFKSLYSSALNEYKNLIN